jgi:hypothetical protein
LIEASSEFDIAGDIGGLLDEGIQGIFLLELRNQPVTDGPLETA